MERLVGIDVLDERELAGRVASWMFILGTVVALVIPLFPGVPGKLLTPSTPLGVVAATWGVISLRKVDWARAAGWAIHAAVFSGALLIAVATSDSGGAQAPVRFLEMMPLVYASYFFPQREAWPYLAIVLGLHALPFAYDRHAWDEGLLGELFVVMPCYAILATLLIKGKRGMVALRAHADELARRDSLTGLANRRALLEAMAIGRHLGLLLLDVDDFKRVNTLYGHPGGDRALRGVADALRAAVRTGDVPARLGGDEFAVLVHDATPDGMSALAERVLQAVRETGVCVSAGWTVGESSTLLAGADLALGEAKRRGKDRALQH